MRRILPAAALAAAIALTAAAGALAAVNLTHYQLSGWSGTVVPRMDAAASYYSCSVGNPLVPGDFYWNVSGINDGDESSGSSFDVTFYLDGEVAAMSAAGPTSTVFLVPNQGPVNNPQGGRHVVSAWIDAFHAIPETDETDNVQGYAYNWAGIILPVGTPVACAAPPYAEGGWDHNVQGPLWYNCSGFEFSGSMLEDWVLVAIYSEDEETNYDMRMHPYNGGSSTTGFSTNYCTSMRGSLRVDAVLFYEEGYMTATQMNVGVLNLHEDSAGYTIIHQAADALDYGVEQTVSLAADERIQLLELAEDSSQALTTSIFLTADPGLGEINLGVFSPNDQYQALDDTAVALGVTDASGELRLDMSLVPSDTYAVVVWRDPEDGSGPWSFTIEADITPADLAPDAGAWYAPLVPTKSAVKPGFPVYLPAELDADYTYLNFRYVNAGSATVKNPQADIDLDGVPVIESTYASTLAAGEAREYNSALLPPSPWRIRGGRHTLTMQLDPNDRISEKDETNNLWGDQFCWKPDNLHYLAIAEYQADPPPPIYGGHGEVTETTMLYNCDGYRLPVEDIDPDGFWRAAALYGHYDDYDLRLHEAFVGNQGGFEGALATSSLPEGRLDIVIANLNVVPDVQYDVSVFNIAEPDPAGGYHIQSKSSEWVANDINGVFGPFEISNPGLFDLLEFHIPAGDVALRLLSESEDTDWGIALMPPDGGFMNLDDALAAAWGNGRGNDVWLTTVVPQDGYCGLVVWRCPPIAMAYEGHYRIWIEPGLTDVGPGIPRPDVTALASVHPNPFNPRTTAAFDLARPGRTRIAVYDLKGALIRVLLDEDLPAGRHEAAWDGRLADGREAASGVYLLRLEADRVRDSRRISLVR